MNTNEKLRQSKLAYWAPLFQEQKSSGLTIKEWCFQNSISFHAFNYWKHLAIASYVDSCLPDIVPLMIPSVHESQANTSNSSSVDSNSTIAITINDVHINISSSDIHLLSDIIKAVRKLPDSNFSSFSGVYIVCGYTDLHYGIDSLAAIIEQKYKMNLFIPNTLFLFCGHSASKIKGLVWEGDGFLLLTKRVAYSRFSWSRTSDDLRSLSSEQFKWLMQGFSIDPIIKSISPTRST